MCRNCKRDIPCKSYQMHTLHCVRNITLCSVCDEPIPKRDFDDHKQQCSASNNDTGNSCESTSKLSKLNPSEHTSASSLQKSIPKEKENVQPNKSTHYNGLNINSQSSSIPAPYLPSQGEKNVSARIRNVTVQILSPRV